MGCYRGWNCCALIPPSTLAGIYRWQHMPLQQFCEALLQAMSSQSRGIPFYSCSLLNLRSATVTRGYCRNNYVWHSGCVNRGWHKGRVFHIGGSSLQCMALMAHPVHHFKASGGEFCTCGEHCQFLLNVCF
jgi:hypothetical protein